MYVSCKLYFLHSQYNLPVSNQAWKGVEEEVTVQLSDRIILSPFAAKRLAVLLGNVVQQYESRFGSLDIGVQSPAPAPTTTTAQ